MLASHIVADAVTQLGESEAFQQVISSAAVIALFVVLTINSLVSG